MLIWENPKRLHSACPCYSETEFQRWKAMQTSYADTKGWNISSCTWYCHNPHAPPSSLAPHCLFPGFLSQHSNCLHLLLHPPISFPTVARVVLNDNLDHSSPLEQQCLNAQKTNNASSCQHYKISYDLAPSFLWSHITFSPWLTLLHTYLFSSSNISRPYLTQGLCTCFALCSECPSFSLLCVVGFFLLCTLA